VAFATICVFVDQLTRVVRLGVGIRLGAVDFDEVMTIERQRADLGRYFGQCEYSSNLAAVRSEL